MRNNKKYLSFILGLIFMLSLVGCSIEVENTQSIANETISNETPTQKENTVIINKKAVTGQLKVHFIDVGQADSILVQQGNSSMLIDAGNNGDAQVIKNYLDSKGVKSLDAVIGTHVLNYSKLRLNTN
jgi:competence protein ComEC